MEHLFHVRFAVRIVPNGFFSYSYLVQMITSMIRGCVVCNDFWSWTISSRSFSHDFATKLLKYGTFHRAHYRSTTRTVLNGFIPYLAQIIISIRWCFACNNFCPCGWYINNIGGLGFSTSFSDGAQLDMVGCMWLLRCWPYRNRCQENDPTLWNPFICMHQLIPATPLI